MTDKRFDWEAIEAEYRAGQLSLREIAKRHGISDTAIRKRAKAEGWTRALADKVREAVREKLVRADGSHSQRTRTDAEIIGQAAQAGFDVVTSHRRDLQQLHGLKRVLADRLATFLQGGQPDGPLLGERESPGDLLEKLSRVTARLIPLERQAHNLDEHPDEPQNKPGGALDRLAARLGFPA
ncbi:hypothetical protein [Methylobacterium isbiliense]|uniref:Uncharacterized protein n=1 Tax=Methylobacterium isbiliense TaxID=315478 RepID=A0ABQ4SDT3_9HYPH|nr:hypothetical protein [Methylobacterium isbiliense]MDN3622584.1 hypothetical protein [Methylobacterium isbiliense]GJE00568.1 hypothetical protein GMJLKIPL_2491 [Methylobacterium isbiliense]